MVKSRIQNFSAGWKSGAESNKCHLAKVSINAVYNFKKSIVQVQDTQECEKL